MIMARNITPRKQTLTYYFSVEGETEKWYLDWLEEQINLQDEAKFKVKIKAEVQKDPVSYAKKLTVQRRTIVWHLSDIEGSTQSHIQSIENTLGRLKDAKNLGKAITYNWGYSNLSFDLWMILHKQNCNAEQTDVGRYLNHINRSFGEQFESMKEYKEEDNFKRCLGKLSLPEVLSAIDRARTIMQRNERDGYPLTQFKGYKYYIHNPSLVLWQPVAQILSDCGLL